MTYPETMQRLREYREGGGKSGPGCPGCNPPHSGVMVNVLVNLYRDRIKMERGILVPKMIEGKYYWFEREKPLPRRKVFGEWVDVGHLQTRKVAIPCRYCSPWPWVFLGPDEQAYCCESEEMAADIAAQQKIRLVLMYSPPERGIPK